jgi:hypothetical protein
MVTHIDAVCGMQVNKQNAVGRSEYQSRRSRNRRISSMPQLPPTSVWSLLGGDCR